MTTNGSAQDIPIYVLENGQPCNSNKLLFRGFVNPEQCVEDDARALTQADGTVANIRLGRCQRSFFPSIRYDTRGLELFDELTKLEDEYYLTACERSLLKTHMDAIAEQIPDGAAIVELGCGSMTKTAIILDYLRRVAMKKKLRFYGLDIDDTYLRQSLAELKAEEVKNNVSDEHAISYAGIHGTYEELVSFLPNIAGPRFFLWLGSSVGNMTWQESTDLLRLYCNAMDPEDGFFLATDKRNDPMKIVRAYNDSKGFIAALGMNTLSCLNHLVGQDVFDLTKFERWSGYNVAAGQYEAYIKSLVDQTIVIPAPFSGDDAESVEVRLKRDELIKYSFSVKYSLEDLNALAVDAGLTLARTWTDPKEMFCFTLLKKSAAEE